MTMTMTMTLPPDPLNIACRAACAMAQSRASCLDISEWIQRRARNAGVPIVTRPSLRPALACMLLLMFGAPMLGTPNARAEDLVLYGAGSLREVMTDITADFTKKTGITVRIA